MSNYTLNRRKFLQGSAVLGAGLLAPAIFSSTANASTKGEVKSPKLITAIGESTFRGWYESVEHPHDPNFSIPQQVENAVNSIAGLSCKVDNRAVSSTRVGYHLGASQAGSEQELAETNTSIVILNFGLNDAFKGTLSIFDRDFSDLIENCKRAGKRVVVTHPNIIEPEKNPKITNPEEQINRLADIADKIVEICCEKRVELVTNGLVDVDLFDAYHPVGGDKGYIKAGKKLVEHVSDIAPVVARQVRIAGAYVALFGRTVEKGGLDYWESRLANEDQDQLLTEMASYVPDYSPTQFVHTVYQNLFGRSAEQGGLDFWSKVITDNPQSGKGQMLNGVIDVMQNETSSRQSDIDTYRHRVHCGMAYGAVYKKSDVAPNHNLAYVNHTWQSVRGFTSSIYDIDEECSSTPGDNVLS